MPRRIDETPVRRRTGVVQDEPSPGTPPDAGQRVGSDAVAITLNDVGNLKFANRYRRKLAIAAASAVAKYLGVLFPAIVVGNFEPEDYFPDDLLASGRASQAQVGGAVTNLAIANPVNSQVLGIVELMVAARLNTAGAVNIRTAATATIAAALGAALATAGFRDIRAGVAGSPTLQLFAGTGAVVGATIGTDFSGVNVSPARIDRAYILPPGQGIDLQTDIVNEGLTAGFYWREVPLPKIG